MPRKPLVRKTGGFLCVAMRELVGMAYGKCQAKGETQMKGYFGNHVNPILSPARDISHEKTWDIDHEKPVKKMMAA